ncbi:MAG: adenylate/guanylate cyclase domain-containing protein [Candidatus Wallbacteria bacterium]|nr:adenylate/guanylate cyclase domain-containing protein [Candidatus Wallbacteria bacterium]
MSVFQEVHLLELRLATARKLDDLFDRLREVPLESVAPMVLSTLDELAPGRQWFLEIQMPDEGAADDALLVESRSRLFSSGPGGDEAASRALADGRLQKLARGEGRATPGVPEPSPTPPPAASDAQASCVLPSPAASCTPLWLPGLLFVPLIQRGHYLGVLGATAPDAGKDELSAVLEEAARRVDTEVDIATQRSRSRIIERLANHALEDYYLERGVERTMRLLILNQAASDIFLVYDQTGLEDPRDIVCAYFTAAGKWPLSIPYADVRAFLADPAAMPPLIRQRIEAGSWLALPLRKREARGPTRTFGVAVFLGASFPYSVRMMLEDVMEDMDSAMINYHEKRRELQRFLCPPVVRSLLEGDRADIEARLAPRRREMALGFVDIVGYSRMCTRYNDLPHQIAALLRDWKQNMREATFLFNGIVDKFVGDCLFYHRGPVSDDPPPRLALDALRIAIGCAAGTQSLNPHLEKYGFSASDTLAVSIGLHIGSDLVVGDIGGEFTAIGADVNITQRIQSNEFTSGKIVVSERFRTYTWEKLPELATAENRFTYGPRTELNLKGVGPFAVYELLKREA